jgi:hypothetical protein
MEQDDSRPPHVWEAHRLLSEGRYDEADQLVESNGRRGAYGLSTDYRRQLALLWAAKASAAEMEDVFWRSYYWQEHMHEEFVGLDYEDEDSRKGRMAYYYKALVRILGYEPPPRSEREGLLGSGGEIVGEEPSE